MAHTGQTKEQAVENVVNAVSEITRIVPRGWNNIQSLNLKTSDSISLPIYTSLPEKSLAIDDTQPPNKKRKMESWNDRRLTVISWGAIVKWYWLNKLLAFAFGLSIQDILLPFEAIYTIHQILLHVLRQGRWLVYCDRNLIGCCEISPCVVHVVLAKTELLTTNPYH